MRKTRQVRIEIGRYEFLKKYSDDYEIPITKVMDLAIDSLSGNNFPEVIGQALRQYERAALKERNARRRLSNKIISRL